MSKFLPVENRPHGDEIRAENRWRIVERECLAVDQYLEEHCQEILQGYCESPISEQRVDDIFAAVKKDSLGHAYRIRHNYLATRLQKIAREHDLDLPNQSRMLVLHGESAPVTPTGFSNLSVAQGWMEGFWADIDTPRERHGADERKLDAGRLVFALVVFGGVHSKKKLQWLIAAIPRGVWHHDGLTWMDVETSRGLWRWFPDPVSLLLLQRWYKIHGAGQWPTGTNTDAAQLSFSFLKFLQVLPDDFASPNHVLRLMTETSSTQDATWIEGALHHIQRIPGATVSLPANAWARLLTKKIPRAVSPTAVHPEHNVMLELRPLTGNCDSDVLAGVRLIQRALRLATKRSKAGERDKTYQSLTAIAADDSWAPIVRVLSSWCGYMRRYGGRQGSLAISSIQKYLSTIANPLSTLLSRTKDLNELAEDEWEFVYDQLLASAPSGKRRSDRAIFAGWFHVFMVEQFGMPEVEIEGATVNGKVDADLLTPAEYVRAQNILSYSTVGTRLITIQKLVLILGFRCGFRRSEIQKILLQDVQGLVEPQLARPELFTRGNGHGGQKSSSGTRRLPLWALLTDDELEQLRVWYRYRLIEPNTTQKDLLFCAPQRGNQLIPQRELFVPIQESMRLASGTASLRFHHLRHSCITLIGLRLFERRPGELVQDDWARDDAGEMVMPHWGRDIFAIANRSTAWAPTRKKLWFLSLLAGHASPAQTLLSYTHVMDYINGMRQAERRTPSLSTRNQANFLACSEGSMVIFRGRHKLKRPTTARDLASAAQKSWPRTIRKTAGKELIMFETPKRHVLVEALEPLPYTAFMIYDALLRVNRLCADGYLQANAIEKTAKQLDLTESTVERWLAKGAQAVQQHTQDGSKRSGFALHSDKTSETLAYKDSVGGVLMPERPLYSAPPRSKVAHGFAEDIFGRIQRWLRVEPAVANHVLNTVADAVQHGHTQLSFTRDEDKRVYLAFLEKAGLQQLVKIRVKVPENGPLAREVKKHWADVFQLPQSRVVIMSQKSKGHQRFPLGTAQIEVRPEPTLGKGGAQNTMSSLRFAIFTLMLIVEEEGSVGA